MMNVEQGILNIEVWMFFLNYFALFNVKNAIIKHLPSTFDIPCSTFDIKSVCSMAKNIIINDVTFLYCTQEDFAHAKFISDNVIIN